ncbi:hypothetical protein C5167_049153 [Papaver somniferum]|uniref:TRF2/HOY1 PH-like domain-containing protein n=2 Tax=Papaver TaxID=3468 RepID=A0A4Y7KMV2_PAPSO|nr:hypothetical protein C5167_049153 [Papaver somniferum]
MVQLMNSGKLRSESDTMCRNNKLSVKLEYEDTSEDEHGPLNKRSKFGPRFQQQWEAEAGTTVAQPSQYNPLDVPSPLGLRLRKSPSLLDLIQMRLAQGNPSKLGPGDGENLDGKKDSKGSLASGSVDKLKASNFPATLLRIGTWECVSRYEGDLVAKCYFAKHKLVWEVLDGGLKSKMEIQWSDILDLKANCPETGPGTLDIVLARQPLFFKETNPQPRKHTLWQATSDFTGGQASLQRRHFLQCPPGLLSKHFEKLIQCDPRLNWLSQQPEVVLESPFFEPKGSVFEDLSESKSHVFDKPKNEFTSTYSGFVDELSPPGPQSSSPKSELPDAVGISEELMSRETPSPSSGIFLLGMQSSNLADNLDYLINHVLLLNISRTLPVMDTHRMEDTGSSEPEVSKGLPSHWDQLKVPGIRPSMSMSDLVNHIGNCISEQMTSGNPLFSEGSENKDMLDEITQYLLSDTQNASASDEKSLMSRVNSLCCLLQKDAVPIQNSQVYCEDGNEGGKHTQPRLGTELTRNNKCIDLFPGSDGDFSDSPGNKPGMSRKDSLGDLLLHLPRIASLPQFLFNISEDGETQAR